MLPEPVSLANLIVFLMFLAILELASEGLDIVRLLLADPSHSFDLNWMVDYCACIFPNYFCKTDFSPRGAPMMGLDAVRLFFLKLFLTARGKLLRLFGLAAASLKS